MKKFRSPYGVSDYTPSDCYLKASLEKTIGNVFECAGFSKVETGALDYYELYEGIVCEGSLNKMFKLTDYDGSLLVLRPDITLQIGRMVATKLPYGLHKLYYVGNSYEFLSDTSGQSARTREFAQIGIEMLGASGGVVDIEAIILAIQALKAAGLEDFLIDIGHVGFFNGMLGDTNLNDLEKVELKNCIDSKDKLGLEMFLGSGKLKMDKSISDALVRLNALYGGIEVLEEAKKLTKNATSLKAIEELGVIAEAVTTAGLEKYISIDLGLLKGGYYSGLVFRGLSKNCGQTLLEGGRYDNVGAQLGKPTPAIGFSVGVKRLMDALGAQGVPKAVLPVDVAFINLDGFSKTEFDKINSLRSQNKRVTKLYNADKKALLDYCKQHKIKHALIFSKKGTEEVEV